MKIAIPGGFSGPLFLVVLCTMASCGQKSQGEVVAVVGGQQITGEDLRKLALNLLPGLRSDEEGQKAREDYLRTLIDREILLLEACDQGLDKDPALLKEFGVKKRDYIISIFYEREIRPQIAVSEEEIRGFFEAQGMGRVRLLSGIRVGTEGEARQILAQVEGGHKFAELAQLYSLDARSAEQGGVVGFVTRPRAERMGIPGVVFDSLQTGAVSLPLAIGNSYQLVRFLEDRPVDLQTHQGRIRRQLMQEKRQDIEAQRVELLAYALGWRMAPEGLELLRKGAMSLEGRTALHFAEKERETPLFTYERGGVSVDEYLDVLHAHKIRTPRALQDSAFIALVARRFILPPTMLMEAAVQLGIPEKPEVRRWIETAKEELLLVKLQQREVSAKISVSEEDVRRFYEEHRDKFHIPETICFDELIVDTEQEAQKLRAEVGGDVDLLELSRARGTHIRQRGADGLACMNSYHQVAYPHLWPALKAAPAGELNGPVPIREGYSIFKVLRREKERQQPFEQARQRARASLVQQRERQRFDAWLLELREKYQNQVTIYADRLVDALPEALLASSAKEL